MAALGRSASRRTAPTTQGRERESRLFEGWRETTHWRKFIENSLQVADEFEGEKKCDVMLRCF